MARLTYNDVYTALAENGYTIHKVPVARTAPGELVMVLNDVDLNFECSDGVNATYIPQMYVDIGWTTDDPDTIVDELIKIVSILHRELPHATFKVGKPGVHILGQSYSISIPVDWKITFDTSDVENTLED